MARRRSRKSNKVRRVRHKKRHGRRNRRRGSGGRKRGTGRARLLANIHPFGLSGV